LCSKRRTKAIQALTVPSRRRTQMGRRMHHDIQVSGSHRAAAQAFRFMYKKVYVH
jgi:hypothetical protein